MVFGEEHKKVNAAAEHVDQASIDAYDQVRTSVGGSKKNPKAQNTNPNPSANTDPQHWADDAVSNFPNQPDQDTHAREKANLEEARLMAVRAKELERLSQETTQEANEFMAQRSDAVNDAARAVEGDGTGSGEYNSAIEMHNESQIGHKA